MMNKNQEFCINFDKTFGQLLDISSKKIMFLKTLNLDSSYIENLKIEYLQKVMDFYFLL